MRANPRRSQPREHHSSGSTTSTSSHSPRFTWPTAGPPAGSDRSTIPTRSGSSSSTPEPPTTTTSRSARPTRSADNSATVDSSWSEWPTGARQTRTSHPGPLWPGSKSAPPKRSWAARASMTRSTWPSKTAPTRRRWPPRSKLASTPTGTDSPRSWSPRRSPRRRQHSKHRASSPPSRRTCRTPLPPTPMSGWRLSTRRPSPKRTVTTSDRSSTSSPTCC